MSTYDDYPDEMPADFDLDDLDRAEWLRPFAEEVRFAVSGPVPHPTPALASFMAGGISTDKGDLLVTAASKVPGPAPQVSGLPKWRKEDTNMPVQIPTAGFLSALLTKLAGAGTAAKAAVAGVTAVATMSVAGAAAGVLPSPAQGAVVGVVNAVSPLNLSNGETVSAPDNALGAIENLTGSLPTTIPAGAAAAVTAPTPAGAAGASATVSTPKAPASLPIPSVPIPAVPSLESLPIPIPVTIPPCVTNLVPVGTIPDPARLVSQIPGCIQSVLGTVGLPVDVSGCLAAVLGTVNGVLSPGSIGSLPQLNVAACVPLDLSKCTSNTMSAMVSATGATSMPFVGEMISSIFASFGGLPGLSSVAGCVPFDIGRCITSVVGGVPGLVTGATGGTTGGLDLSACLPTGITAGLPGLPAGIPGIPGLSGIPFLGGGIPFIGSIPFFGSAG